MDAEHEDMGNNHGMRRRFVEACEKEIDTDDLRNGSTGQVLRDTLQLDNRRNRRRGKIISGCELWVVWLRMI